MASLSSVKAAARTLLSAALNAVDPYQATLARFRRKGNILSAGRRRYNLPQFSRIYVIGAGKAACGMAQAVERVIGNRISAGLITVPRGYHCAPPLRRIKVVRSGHPMPDAAGLRAALKAKALAESVTANDLVIYLASGGGSALMTLPAPGITLPGLRQTTQLLLQSGAPMPQINCVRKHLDLLKGGQLAQLVYPATVITLVLSDIIGNRLDMVGGGPTLPDPNTFKDACNILAKYRLWRKVLASVRRRIKSGLVGSLPETPKPGNRAFRKNRVILIGSNRIALETMAVKAKSLGLNSIVRPEPVIGEARLIAQKHASLTARLSARRERPVFILSGGETTVTIDSNGRGGRNQEYALAFALEMEKFGLGRFVCLSAGTDGVDYIRGVAGAMVDGTSLTRARQLGLDPEQLLRTHNSYHFHKPIGTLIKIKPTGTNVNDVQIIAVL